MAYNNAHERHATFPSWATGMYSPLLILTTTPLPSTLGFADALAEISRTEIIIVSDNKPFDLPSVAKCIYIDDIVARENGFFNSSPIIAKTPTAWDKAIYYITHHEKAVDYVWIMEDDVFFTNPAICVALMEKYSNDTSDLIVRNFFLRDQHQNWPHWHFAARFRREHQAGAFLPLCRLSHRMAELTRDFVREHGSLDFIEVMFASLATCHNLTIKIMNFISERRFHGGPGFRTLELLQLWGDDLENGIFHPVKSDRLRSMSYMRPPGWQLQLCKMVGPFFTRQSQLAAYLRANAYSLTESQIRSMIDGRPS
jgi:hypothetical protein